MALSSFSFNEVAIDTLLNSPTGPVADEMARIARTSLLEIAKATIGRTYPGGPAPAPGPPYRRTGILQSSLTVETDPSSPAAAIVPGPEAVRGGWNYGEVLLKGLPPMKGQYRFLPDEFY
jgi:hypothetical protein